MILTLNPLGFLETLLYPLIYVGLILAIFFSTLFIT